jgi:hypothetical protein
MLAIIDGHIPFFAFKKRRSILVLFFYYSCTFSIIDWLGSFLEERENEGSFSGNS